MDEEKKDMQKKIANAFPSSDFEEEFEKEYEEVEHVSIEQIEEIGRLRREAKVIVNGYIKKHFDKQALEDLTTEEGKKLKSALEEYLRNKGVIAVGDYTIKPIENGFYEVRKKDGTVYTVHPKEGLCDCPDMKFRTKEACKHVDMVIENVPKLKKELEEREKVKGELKKREHDQYVDRWSVEEVLKKVSDELIAKYYVYEFVQDGKTIVGLTADAITDIAHWMGGIETVDEHVLDTEDKYLAKVIVRDITRNFTVSGFAEEPKSFGKGRQNKFAARIAFRKAQRNALSRLIPKFVHEKLISRYKELKSLKTQS